MLHNLRIFFFVIVFSVILSLSLSAVTPENSYTYWSGITGGRTAVSSKPMYKVYDDITADSLGIEQIGELNDVCIDTEGNSYLLDGKKSRIIKLDKDYKLLSEINSVISDGVETQFKDAKSIYVDDNGLLYICDTEGSRVLITDENRKVIDVITVPDSGLIPDNFIFAPIKVAVDSSDNIYVLCRDSYQGALLFDKDHTFCGFFGSNKVSLSVVESISNAVKRVFSNNERLSVSGSTLPYSFSDIIIDKNDFVYTATGSVSKSEQTGQIKKFNPSGDYDILNLGTMKFGDEEFNATINIDDGLTANLYTDILGVAVDDNGFIYCLEASYGKVFVYDGKGNNLTVFGGGMREGFQKGAFKNPSAIALNGTDVLVVDRLKGTLTVFEEMPYGKLVKEMQCLTNKGNYSKAAAGWQDVLSQDANSQLAYVGLARAAYDSADYEKAMKLAKTGCDRDTYNLAFTEIRNKFNADYFPLFFILIVLVLGLSVFFVILSSKRQLVIIKNKDVRDMLSSVIHPFEKFADIKEHKTGSLTIAWILIALFGMTSVFKTIYGGFLFTDYVKNDFNSISEMARNMGIVVLWIVCSWALSSIMHGIGTLKEITIVTSYSLIPLIIWNILDIVLSNTMVMTEGGFFKMAEVIFLIIFAIMIIAGTTVIHDYDFFKFLGFVLLTVFAMAVVVLLIVLIGLLFSQFVNFVMTLYVETVTW